MRQNPWTDNSLGTKCGGAGGSYSAFRGSSVGAKATGQRRGYMPDGFPAKISGGFFCVGCMERTHLAASRDYS